MAKNTYASPLSLDAAKDGRSGNRASPSPWRAPPDFTIIFFPHIFSFDSFNTPPLHNDLRKSSSASIDLSHRCGPVWAQHSLISGQGHNHELSSSEDSLWCHVDLLSLSGPIRCRRSSYVMKDLCFRWCRGIPSKSISVGDVPSMHHHRQSSM